MSIAIVLIQASVQQPLECPERQWASARLASASLDTFARLWSVRTGGGRRVAASTVARHGPSSRARSRLIVTLVRAGDMGAISLLWVAAHDEDRLGGAWPHQAVGLILSTCERFLLPFLHLDCRSVPYAHPASEHETV